LLFTLLSGGLQAEREATGAEREAEEPRRTNGWVEVFPQVVHDELYYLSEFFGVRLPETLGKYNLALNYNLKFGDFVRRDYLRFPVTLSYGVTERTDLLLGMTPFSPNPFRSGDDSRWGPGLLRTGVRHNLERPLFGFHQTSLGLDVVMPLGRPPIELADHYGRLRPSITFSRNLERMPDTRFLLGLVHDHSFSVPYRAENPAFFRTNVTEISPGLLYKPGNLGYLAEYTLRFLDEETGDRIGHVYTVGLLWDVPEKYVPRFLPGRWRVDVGYRLTDEDERDLHHSVHTRVHVRFDFRQFMREVQKGRQEFGQRFGNRGDRETDF
jgi:hypothetical protein